MGGLLAAFDLPGSGPVSLKGMWVVFAIEASEEEVREGQTFDSAVLDTSGTVLHGYFDRPLKWITSNLGRPYFRTSFQIQHDWAISVPGRYNIGARVDGEVVDGAIEFHVLPPGGGALRDEQDIAAEANGSRVDWAHLCLKWPLDKPGEPPYWIEDISEYCPILEDREKRLAAAIVALVSFGYQEGPYHTWRIEVTGPPSEPAAPISSGPFTGERFGLQQPFRKILSAPFAATFPGPGLYTFHIFLDDVLAHKLEYPIVRVQQLPPGWAKIESQTQQP